MKKIILLIAVLSTSLLHAGWSGNTKIKTFYPHPNNGGTVYFKFDRMINPGGCANTDYISLQKSNPMFTELYSLLLSSLTSNTPVNYYVSTSFDKCDTQSRAVIFVVRVSK